MAGPLPFKVPSNRRIAPLECPMGCGLLSYRWQPAAKGVEKRVNDRSIGTDIVGPGYVYSCQTCLYSERHAHLLLEPIPPQ